MYVVINIDLLLNGKTNVDLCDDLALLISQSVNFHFLRS